MKKNQHQTVQTTKSGTSDKSSAGRVQIPEFEAPIAGQKATIPAPKIDLEAAVNSILDKEKDHVDLVLATQGDVEYQESQKEDTPKKKAAAPKDDKYEALYQMVVELQKRGGSGSDLEMVWAEAIATGKKNIEIPEPAYLTLTRTYVDKDGKYKDPGSVIYKEVRMFKEGTMDHILENEGLDVNYVRGLSTRKYANSKFRGRG